MAKKISGYVKLQIPAGSANPAPPIGSVLGQRGVNIMGFCKAFNAATQHLEKSLPIPTIITIYHDKSFDFQLKSSPVSYFLKKAANLTKGSTAPGRDIVGSVTLDQVREIAQTKMSDLNTTSLDAAVEMVRGSARSMGLEVKG